jgi:hypothetical protein
MLREVGKKSAKGTTQGTEIYGRMEGNDEKK